MEVVAVHFTPFPGGPPAVPITEFELDFSNGNTDVRVTTMCSTQLMDTAPTPVATGGCEYKLDPDGVGLHRQVEPRRRRREDHRARDDRRHVRDQLDEQRQRLVRRAGRQRRHLLLEVEHHGAAAASAATSGRKAFGSSVPEEQITGVAGTNLANATCFGCHALSKDGKRMVVNFDDADSDDEYADVVHTLMDPVSKNSLDGHNTYGQFQPGLPGHLARRDDVRRDQRHRRWREQYLLHVRRDDRHAAGAGDADHRPGHGRRPRAARPTQPDWAPDGKSLLYVQPDHVGSWDSNGRNDDNHVFGGCIMSATLDPTTMAFGTPTPRRHVGRREQLLPGLLAGRLVRRLQPRARSRRS